MAVSIRKRSAKIFDKNQENANIDSTPNNQIFEMLSVEEAKQRIDDGLSGPYRSLSSAKKTIYNKRLKERVKQASKKIYEAKGISTIAIGIEQLLKISTPAENKDGHKMLEEAKKDAKEFLKEIGLPSMIPKDKIKRNILWKNRNKDALKVWQGKKLLEEWIELYKLPEGTKFADAKKYAKSKGWSTTEKREEFLIDKKVWSLIFKKLSPTASVYFRSNIKIQETLLTISTKRGRITPEMTLEPKKEDDIMLYKMGLLLIDESHLEELKRVSMIVFVQLGFLPADGVGDDIAKEVADANKVNFGSDSKGYVYFIRNGNLHKIGITEDLVRRFKELAPDEILNVVRCENYDEVEKILHARYKKVRLPQTEYFRLDDSQISELHKSLIELASF